MNKKKCGIVTYHRAHNYGALLQAYALKKSLQKLSLEPVFIDYQPESISKGYELYPQLSKEKSISAFIRYAKDFIHLILDYKRKKNRFIVFETFIKKEINTHKPEGVFEYLFLGSDQIWNASYTNGVDKHYYGIFDNLTANNTISYAASMGTSKLNAEEEYTFIKYLKGLDGIGVREEELSNYISSISSLNSEVNLDPTLLLSKTEWSSLNDSANIHVGDKPYLLIYEVHEHKLTQQVKEFISKKLDLNVISLSSRTNFYTNKNNITNASPNDFIKLFSNASFVITTSFHGTVFSIINEVPFLTLKFNNDTDIRSESLLKKVNLSERHIGNIADIESIPLEFSFEKSNLLLEKYRKKSIDFLKSFIRG
ncbi:polysaccharide pyruvyl transferase family protein [Proteus terrae]|uniref:polysaccharide pyruvyl transferase family protein n=1 Tax=Proteus terrae TaxID=1574161 RepID=UPI000D69AA3C|nr:polysaccharide pyruvyl transferase family protein [Proteus terrae]